VVVDQGEYLALPMEPSIGGVVVSLPRENRRNS